MKKLLLLIMLLPSLVHAASYTDYELAIKGSDKYYEETDLLKREVYYEYNTYEIKKHYLNYREDCPLYDKDDYYDRDEYLTKFNNTGAYGAFYEQGKVYEINMRSVSVITDIYEINIYYNNQKIPFTYTTTKIEHPEYMHDGDLNTKGILSRFANIHLYFDPVDFAGLTIELVGANSIYVSTCTLSYYDENNEPKTKNIAILGLVFMFVNETKYNELINQYGESAMADGVSSFYLHKYRYYHCYEEVKEPTGIYKKEGDNLIMDDYHIKYNYYKRDLIDDKNVLPNLVDDNNTLTNSEDLIINNNEETVITPISNKKKIRTTKKATSKVLLKDEKDIPVVEPLSNTIKEDEPEGIFWLLYLFFLILLIILILVLKRLRKEE